MPRGKPKVLQLDDPEWMTVISAAAFVESHPDTIRSWIHDGHLTAYRFGPTARYIRIKRSDLEALMTPIVTQPAITEAA